MEHPDNSPSPQRKGRYYGDGGLYKYVKVPVRVVEYIIVVLIVVLIACILFGTLNGGYTVSFDSMGGTRVEPQGLKYGDYVQQPEDPTMEGYLFAGWYTDEGGTQPWDFQNSTVYDSMTLYAAWTEKSTN